MVGPKVNVDGHLSSQVAAKKDVSGGSSVGSWTSRTPDTSASFPHCRLGTRDDRRGVFGAQRTDRSVVS